MREPEFGAAALAVRAILEGHEWNPNDEQFKHITPAQYATVMDDASKGLFEEIMRSIEKYDSRITDFFVALSKKNSTP